MRHLLRPSSALMACSILKTTVLTDLLIAFRISPLTDLLIAFRISEFSSKIWADDSCLFHISSELCNQFLDVKIAAKWFLPHLIWITSNAYFNMQVAIFRRNVDSQADEKVTGGGSVFQNQLFNSVTYHAQLRQDAQADTDTLTDVKPTIDLISWRVTARQLWVHDSWMMACTYYLSPLCLTDRTKDFWGVLLDRLS